jgi:succinate-semialdehyde dehydrogenase/glutarate-semialdehyde dehydrogenase
VGPTLLITPWNFPIAMATRKIGPALAAGCTVVIKPASLTPMTTLLVAEIIRSEAAARGLPTGIVNVIPTSQSGPVTEPLFEDPRLRKVSFTGSTRVGQILLAQASKNVLRSSMELGGNAPFVVFEDADLDAAVEGALIAKLRNSGQSCVAANRFLVHDAVARAFAEKFAEAMAEKVTAPGISNSLTFFICYLV